MLGDMARHYLSPWLFDRKYSMTFTTSLQAEFRLINRDSDYFSMWKTGRCPLFLFYF